MGASWDLSHDPFTRPLGCNGRYGPAGFNRHRYRGEKACAACKASAAHYRREYRRKAIKPRKLQPCGTVAAAARHRAKGEELCFPCRVAVARKRQEFRTKQERVTLPSKGPNSPYSVGRRTLLARTCMNCGQLADGDSFPVMDKKKNLRRKVCHICHNRRKKADREQRGIGVPEPRPAVELQTSAYRHWSKEDDRQLRLRIDAGESYEDIATVLGRSLRSVYKRRSDLGLAAVRKKHRVEKPWKVQPSLSIAEEIPK